MDHGGYLRVSQSPSLRGSGHFEAQARAEAEERARLNPLHCGAVVASGRARQEAAARARVSIPFIAGQWSLQVDSAIVWRAPDGSQSPSLRGSGRFTSWRTTRISTA